MKWFQLDADMPHDAAMMRVIGELGNDGLGGLVRIWCFVAGHGDEDQPGRAINGKGRPYTDAELAAVSGLDLRTYTRLRDICLETEHFDPEPWKTSREIFVPAMLKRADEWTRRRLQQKNSRESRENSRDKRESHSAGSGESRATRQDSTEQDNFSFGEERPAGDQAEQMLRAWNELTAAPIPRAKEFSKDRREKARRRLQERSLSAWGDVFKRIAASAFCAGSNDRGWVATFDWILANPDNAIKVLEGKYDDRKKASPPTAGRVPAPAGKYAGLGSRDEVTTH